MHDLGIPLLGWEPAHLAFMLARVAQASGAVSWQAEEVAMLPAPERHDEATVSCTAHPALTLRLFRLTGLKSAQYRVGDMTKGLFRRLSGASGGASLRPYVRVSIIASDDDVADTCFDSARTRILDGGDTLIGETLVLTPPCPRTPSEMSSSGVARDATVAIKVYNAVGIQSVLRGDPLIGSVSIPLSTARCLAPNTELVLERNGECRGRLQISFAGLEARPRREITLAKHSLLPVAGLKKAVCTHWGLAVGEPDGEPDVYEVIATGLASGGPMAVIGPRGRGLIAHTVGAAHWQEWKDTIVRQRGEAGFLGEEAFGYYTRGESIPDGELRRLVHSRDLAGFDAKQVKLQARTRRTDDEIEEFAIEWVRANPVYDAIEANCQRFIKALYTFLTCGHELQYRDLHDAINTATIACAATTAALTGPVGAALTATTLTAVAWRDGQRDEGRVTKHALAGASLVSAATYGSMIAGPIGAAVAGAAVGAAHSSAARPPARRLDNMPTAEAALTADAVPIADAVRPPARRLDNLPTVPARRLDNMPTVPARRLDNMPTAEAALTADAVPRSDR